MESPINRDGLHGLLDGSECEAKPSVVSESPYMDYSGNAVHISDTRRPFVPLNTLETAASVLLQIPNFTRLRAPVVAARNTLEVVAQTGRPRFWPVLSAVVP